MKNAPLLTLLLSVGALNLQHRKPSNFINDVNKGVVKQTTTILPNASKQTPAPNWFFYIEPDFLKSNQGQFKIGIRTAKMISVNIKLYTITGLLVLEKDVNSLIGSVNIPIDIPSNETNNYILKVESTDKTILESKFITKL